MTSLEPTYAQLKIMYPAYYQRQVDIQNYYNDSPDPDATIERNLRTMYSQDPVPLPKIPVDLIDGYDPEPNIPIYTPVTKESTSYMMPILIAVLFIILFLIFSNINLI